MHEINTAPIFAIDYKTVRFATHLPTGAALMEENLEENKSTAKYWGILWVEKDLLAHTIKKINENITLNTSGVVNYYFMLSM